MSELKAGGKLKTQKFCPLCKTPFADESARPPYLSTATSVRVADMTLRDTWGVIKKAGELCIGLYSLTLLYLALLYFVPTGIPSFTLIDWPVSLPSWAKWWALGTLASLVMFSCGTLTDFGLFLVALGETWSWASVKRRILWILVPPIVALFLYHSTLLTLLVLIPCYATWYAIDEWKQREQRRRDG